MLCAGGRESGWLTCAGCRGLKKSWASTGTGIKGMLNRRDARRKKAGNALEMEKATEDDHNYSDREEEDE